MVVDNVTITQAYVTITVQLGTISCFNPYSYELVLGKFAASWNAVPDDSLQRDIIRVYPDLSPFFDP